MSKHSFHDTRGTKNMLAHGVQQRIGVFRPRPGPATPAKGETKETSNPVAAPVRKRAMLRNDKVITRVREQEQIAWAMQTQKSRPGSSQHPKRQRKITE